MKPLLCICLIVAAVVVPRLRAADKPPPPPADPVAALAEPRKFAGLEANMKMGDALEKLNELYQVQFDVNEAAFQAEGVENVMAVPLQRQLPKMYGVSLDRILRQLLARIPSESGATYLVRGSIIELTTTQAARKEVWGADYQGPFLPLVQVDYDQRHLDDALADLAERGNRTIVLDTRIGQKASAKVSARLRNTPLDTAVRLLADMADLKTFLIDNVLYVTTPENAARLEAQEQQRINDDPAGGARRAGTMPGRSAPAGM